ncbi:DUF551 domain-containing protein, partial [Neisseria bacilliformis]|uniref:DUF551 domain-containing protein n=1 Tax=Neisseria bacilliformis TaxID=267212 RepID=UPI003C7152C6
EQIERIKQLVADLSDEADLCRSETCDDFANLLWRAMDAIEFLLIRAQAARAGQTGWISVEDKLPEADAIVLAVVRNNPEVGLFSLVDFGDDGLRWSIVTIEGVCPVDDLRITHWQPLPQPPEGATA